MIKRDVLPKIVMIGPSTPVVACIANPVCDDAKKSAGPGGEKGFYNRGRATGGSLGTGSARLRRELNARQGAVAGTDHAV